MAVVNIIIYTNTLLTAISSIRNLIDNACILSHVCNSGCTVDGDCRKPGTDLGLAGRREGVNLKFTKGC